MKKMAEIGDLIKVGYISKIIGRIIYQDYDERDGWIIEGEDNHGQYFMWKQWSDGGELIRRRTR